MKIQENFYEKIYWLLFLNGVLYIMNIFLKKRAQARCEFRPEHSNELNFSLHEAEKILYIKESGFKNESSYYSCWKWQHRYYRKG